MAGSSASPLTLGRVATQDADLDVSGASLQGYIDTTYEVLLKALGPPVFGPDGPEGEAPTCEWRLQLSDGSAWRLYDRHSYGPTPRRLYPWHLGGMTSAAASVAAALGLDDWRDAEGRLHGKGRTWAEQRQHARRPKRARPAPAAGGASRRRAPKKVRASATEEAAAESPAAPEEQTKAPVAAE